MYNQHLQYEIHNNYWSNILPSMATVYTTRTWLDITSWIYTIYLYTYRCYIYLDLIQSPGVGWSTSPRQCYWQAVNRNFAELSGVHSILFSSSLALFELLYSASIVHQYPISHSTITISSLATCRHPYKIMFNQKWRNWDIM